MDSQSSSSAQESGSAIMGHPSSNQDHARNSTQPDDRSKSTEATYDIVRKVKSCLNSLLVMIGLCK